MVKGSKWFSCTKVAKICSYEPGSGFCHLTTSPLMMNSCLLCPTGHVGRRLRRHASLRRRAGEPEHLEQETFRRRDLQLGNLQQQSTGRQRLLLDGEQHRNIRRSDQMDLRALPFAQLNCIPPFQKKASLYFWAFVVLVFIWRLLETVWVIYW